MNVLPPSVLRLISYPDMAYELSAGADQSSLSSDPGNAGIVMLASASGMSPADVLASLENALHPSALYDFVL